MTTPLSTTGLLCYYTFDTNPYSSPAISGTTIFNSAINAYDLSYTGTAGVVSISTTQSKYGGASLFNNLYSVGNYYSCSSYVSSMNISNGFTFACWVYFQSGLSGYLFLIGDSTSNIGLSVTGPFIVLASYGTASGINVQYNQPGSYGWHHILITASYSNPTTTITIYVNGTPTTSIFGTGGNPFGGSGGSAPTNSTLTYNSQILTGDKSMYLLGYKTTIASIGTYIDEVFLFNRVLSSTEISTIYNKTYSPFFPLTSAYISPIIYPCFLQGSKILCLDPESDQEVYVAVETLREGDLVKTLNSGFKSIFHIGRKTIPNPTNDPDPRNRLYRFQKSQIPYMIEDLCITGEHCTLHRKLSPEFEEMVRKHMGDIYITEYQYRVPACIDKRAVSYEGEGPATIWHFALENHNIYHNYGVFANGLLVESCSIQYLTELAGMELVSPH